MLFIRGEVSIFEKALKNLRKIYIVNKNRKINIKTQLLSFLTKISQQEIKTNSIECTILVARKLFQGINWNEFQTRVSESSPTSNHKWRARVRLMGSLGVGTPAASRSHFYASSYPRGIASTCTRPDCLSQRWSKEGGNVGRKVGDRGWLAETVIFRGASLVSGFTIISFLEIRFIRLRVLVH